jgi:ABC-2 type transport system permease protein
MGTFKAYFKKEIKESLAQYKYIVLAAGIIVFAVLEPITLKLLPTLLKGKIPGDLSSLFVINQKTAVLNYIKDLFQIGSFFVVFVHCGTLSDETYNEKLVFPYSKGAKPSSIVLAKTFHYTLVVLILTYIGFIINYSYSQVLFKENNVKMSMIMVSALLISLYFLFNICLVTLLSSLLKKSLSSGLLTLALNFISIPFLSIKVLAKFIPYTLVKAANEFSLNDMTFTIIFFICSSGLLIWLTIIRMNKIEVI